MSIIIPLHKVARTFIKHSMFALKQTINFPEINPRRDRRQIERTQDVQSDVLCTFNLRPVSTGNLQTSNLTGDA